MAPISSLFLYKYWNSNAALLFQLMAEIFQDLLCNRDDYLRALRALLREIMRAVRQDMNFPEFALGLMQERTETKFRDMDSQLKVSRESL